MGEYATYKGSQIKIGTCESMYYLREGQRGQIGGYDFGADVLEVIRFRFPFPDEDSLEPGSFEDYDRGERIPGWQLPAEFDDHGSVQFVAREAGYLLSLPCPEQFGRDDNGGTEVDLSVSSRFTGSTFGTGSVRVGRNGFNGGPVLVAQGFRGGELRSVVRCNACGAMWNLEREQAEEVAACFRAEADRGEFRADLSGWGPANSEHSQRELHTIADRILAGYRSEVTA